MLSDFHNAVSEQRWWKAINDINYYKCNPNVKGANGLSARELASPYINKIAEIDYTYAKYFRTPLEDHLAQESQYAIKGDIAGTKALISLGANVNQKNPEGDNALMYYLKRVAGSKKLLSLKIIKFLIAEGSDFSPNNNQENPIDFAKVHFGGAVAQYMQKLVPVVTQTENVIKIQRACRKFINQQQSLNRPKTPEEIAKTVPPHPMLTLQPKIPQADNSIDPIKAQEWVNLHDEEDQRFAKKVLKKIDHVSFERFMFGLKQTIEKWNEFIMSRPASNRDYALLLDQRAEKSSQWVTSLALPYLAHPPSQIILMNEEDLKNVRKDVHHLVILDDATYSGNQVTGLLDTLLPMRARPEYQHLLNKEFHFIAPFISENGKKRLSEREINIIHHETIPNFDNNGLNISGQTATYFAHKIAQEGISTINIISTGETIRGKPGIRFIPSTAEPYKSTSS
jgi:hypothetical protein